MNYKMNSYQTTLTEELEKTLPKEVYDEIIEFIASVKFIDNLIQPEEVRGFIKDKPIMTYTNDDGEQVEYEDGRREIDISNPHILEGMDFFREKALFFEKTGKYTNIIPNSNPKSDYANFWREEVNKWRYGLVREDGEWIPGELYFYWNYSPIWLVEKDKQTKGNKKGNRVKKFPKPWLGDYLFYHYVSEAKEKGKHGKLLKTRGIGFPGPISEPILTTDGFKTYGDIKVNDNLIDRKGNPTKVTQVHKQDNRIIYELTLNDKRTVRCAEGHLWSVFDKNKGTKNKNKLYTYSIEEIIKKGLYWKNKKGNKLYKYYIPDLLEPVKYSKKEFKIDPYVIGALLGDGSLNTSSIKIASIDNEILDNIQKLIGNSYKLVKDKSTINYLFTQKNLWEGGSKYKHNKIKNEIINLKLNVNTSGKFIPDIYKHSSINQRLDLVKGLMDTDGSISLNGNLEFSNSNKTLIDDLAEVLRSLGIACTKGLGRKPRKKEINESICNIKQEYRLYIRSNQNLFNLTRKSEKVKNKKLFKNSPIVNIKKLDYIEECVCFTVDNKENLYLTTDFIPTHNSFKAASWSPRNLYCYPGSGNPNFHLASEKGYLSGDKGIWGKVLDTLDWLAEHTPLSRMRLVDGKRSMEIQLGYEDEYGSRKGLLSSIYGISLKDNPDKARGIRGPFIHYEEDGLFPNLEKAWNVNRKAVEDGGVASGFMLAGGCLTENNMVWDGLGNLTSIKDLNRSNRILGFNQSDNIISQEPITYWQPPTNKECVKITTNTGRSIECSLDHPILWSHKSLKKMSELPSINGNRKRKSLKKVEFKEAGLIKIGEQLATVNEVPIFSDKEMWEPRLIGWLVGDGSYGFNKTPILSNCEGKINSYLHNQLLEEVVTEKTYTTKSGKTYEENRIKGICKKLRKIGIYGQTKNKKTLPINIHSYSYKTITEFIGGFFDADGYVSKEGVVSLSCAYSNILLEMQLLLQKLGIHGNVNYKNPNPNNSKSKNGHYELEIKDKDSVLNFKKHIFLFPKEKYTRLNNVTNIYKNKESQNANHLTGMRFERVVSIENIGIKPVYNLTAGKTNTYIGNGIITHNTGGVEGASFEGSEKLFYNPNAYNILGVPNVYDRNSNPQVECGFFWGAYLNRNRCYDENQGEPDIIKALIEICTDRFKVKYSSSDSSTITQKKAEEPITPQEAIMRTEGTVFPVADLKTYFEDIYVDKENFLSNHYVGDLITESNGNIKWKINSDITPLRRYDLATNDKTGAVEIFEMPKKNGNGIVFRDRYIAGIDPVDSDTGNSLYSVFIMDSWTDRIVAEYTGRPKLIKEAYNITIKLLLFYNAEANYESNLKGLFTHFSNRNCLYLLCDTPQILKDMELVKLTGQYGNKAKGTHASAAINKLGRDLQAEWMMSDSYGEDNIWNLHKIRSFGYIEEAIKWNADGNFDRISSMGMLMILREERKKRTQQAKENKDKKLKQLSEDPFFSKNYTNVKDRETKRAMEGYSDN